MLKKRGLIIIRGGELFSHLSTLEEDFEPPKILSIPKNFSKAAILCSKLIRSPLPSCPAT